MPVKPTLPIKRFLPKLVVIPNGCWLWLGFVSRQSGYARFFFEGQSRPAHRFAYKHIIGPIPDTLELDHLCRNRECVNPYHLEPVTPAVNKERGDRTHLGRWQRETTHCPQGHPYDESNTWLNPKLKNRHCRTCNRERMRARRAQARAAVEAQGVGSSRF